MKSIESYEEIADKLTDEATKYTLKRRLQIGMKIRKEVLLPFCRKHSLTMYISPYGNQFTTSDGERIDAEDLPKHIDDPIAEQIDKYLCIYFQSDYIFDYGMGFDIEKEDLKVS